MTRTQGYSKTVYVLGAGFSNPAGGPNQNRITELLLELPEKSKVKRYKANLVKFLTSTLKIPKSEIKNRPLEDIYTPIDRCLADRVSLRGLTQTQLENLRDELDYLIAHVIKQAFETSDGDPKYVYEFSRFLVGQAKERARLAGTNADKAKKHDPFSIISLNWDILLDNALDQELAAADAEMDFHDYDPFGVVDYCCYVSSLQPHDRRIRSGLWSLGAKGYNVKLLKIHGSMNWLQCSNCQRLFTAFGKKLIGDLDRNNCRHCEVHGIKAPLRGTLIMPTFLKDFSNFQLQLVWQNAAVELMEASRIVFIGYSLPESDFEFRQLLTRMIHPKAKVHAVLWRDKTNPRPYNLEKQRYLQFFAGHEVTFDPKGVTNFVAQEVKTAKQKK